MKGLILILLLSFIMSCTRLEIEPASHTEMVDIRCFATKEVILLPDGSALGWECLPDSVKDGELRMDWNKYPESQRQGEVVLFAVYQGGPDHDRAYRRRIDDLGIYIVREGKKVYLYSPSVLEGKVN